jgi:methionine synthase I (cobalamin-dependent)
MQSASRFLHALHTGEVLLMDGAMGTELQRAGMPEGSCYELWNLTHPERVRAVHRAYVDAGAQCILTHTFQANRAALGRHQLPAGQMRDIFRAALANARDATGPDRFVLADVGPIEATHSDCEAPYSVYRDVVRHLGEADAILLETSSHWDVLSLAASTPDVLQQSPPVLLSLAYQRDGSGQIQTVDGHSPDDYARAARGHGLAALGVNCGKDIGIDEILTIVRRYRQATDLPLFARPNAGTPIRSGDHWVYPHSPATLAERLPELLDAGVAMVGGCCGTTPEHIAALRPVVAAWNARHSPQRKE